MSLLIDDQKFINLLFHYIETDGPYITKLEFIKTKEDFERYKNSPFLKEIKTGWKVPTWSDHNWLYHECSRTHVDEKGIESNSLDIVKYRELKLKMCLKQWDLKDNNGRTIPISDETVDKLHPDVASELLNGFERVTEASTQDLKNLTMAARAFFEGKSSIAQPPKIVYEFYIKKVLPGMSFKEIRNLPMPDFVKILHLCTAWESVEKSGQLELATIGLPKNNRRKKMKLFVDENDVIKVVVYAFENAEKDLIFTVEEKEVPADVQPETLEFEFRVPNNRDVNELTRMCFKVGIDGSQQIDPVVFQDASFRKLIKKWNLKDASGKVVDITPKAIDQLDGRLARAASSALIGSFSI